MPVVYAWQNSPRNINFTPNFVLVTSKGEKVNKVDDLYLPEISLSMKFVSITKQPSKKTIPLFFWNYDLENVGDYEPLQKDVILRSFPLSPGVRKYRVYFTMIVDGNVLPKPMGVSEIKLIIPGAKPLKYNNYYLPLIEHSAKVLSGVTTKKKGRLADYELVKKLVYKLKELKSNVDKSKKIQFKTPDYYSLNEDGLDNGLSGSMNQFLDQYGGNGEAWCNALKQMANFQGIPLKTVKFKNYYGSFNTRNLGINPSPVPLSYMNILTGAFPGIPKEGRDLTKKNLFYQYIKNHAVNILKDGQYLWLFEPSLYNSTNNTNIIMQKGKFEVLSQFLDKNNKDILFAKYNDFTEFNEKYLSKLFDYFTINHMPYFKSSNDVDYVLDYKKISIPINKMLTRPAYISFMESYSPLSDKIKEKLAKIKKFIKKNMKDVISGGEDTANPGAEEPDNAAQKEILKIGDMMKPSSYLNALGECEKFLRMTDQNNNSESYKEYEKEVYILTYIYSRALLLFAAEEFGKQYHIPGWELDKESFKTYKDTLLGEKQRIAIDRLLTVTNSIQTANRLDEYADTRYIIAKYYQMAGLYDDALTLLKQVKEKHDNDPEMFVNHYPWVIWLMAETYTYKKDYVNAIQLKTELIDNYATKYPELIKTAEYSRASDYLFSEDYINAKKYFNEFSGKYKSSKNVAGANIFEAYAHQKLDNNNEAEKLLKNIIDTNNSDSDVKKGYVPMAYLSLTALYADSFQYDKAIALAKKFEIDFPPAGPPSSPAKESTSNFYKIWSEIHKVGIFVKKAKALRLKADKYINSGETKNAEYYYNAALELLNKLDEKEGDYDDENSVFKHSAIGLPYPKMVYPAWGSDLGDYSNLLKEANSGKKLDKSLKLKTQEYGRIRVKFANQYRNAIKFNRAMTYISRGNEGDDELAQGILKELSKQYNPANDNQRDSLIVPIIGANIFLLANSPQKIDQHAKLAYKMVNGKSLVDLDIDSNYDGKITEEDDKLEETQGGAIRLLDYRDPSYLEIKIKPGLNSGKIILDRKYKGDGSVLIGIDSFGKKEKLTLPKEWILPNSSIPKKIIVIGKTSSSKAKDIQFILSYYDEENQFITSDRVNATVCELIFTFWGYGHIVNGGSLALNSLTNYLIDNLKMKRINNRYYYLNKNITGKSFIVETNRKLGSEVRFSEALQTEGCYITYHGHSNLGIGLSFHEDLKNYTSLNNFYNIGTKIVPIHYPDWLKSKPKIQITESMIMNNVLNYNNLNGDPKLTRFKNISFSNHPSPWYKLKEIKAGMRFPNMYYTTNSGNTVDKYHYYNQDYLLGTHTPSTRLLISAPGKIDLPQNLKYKYIFMNSCESGHHFGNSFTHGTYFYSIEETLLHRSIVRAFVVTLINYSHLEEEELKNLLKDKINAAGEIYKFYTY